MTQGSPAFHSSARRRGRLTLLTALAAAWLTGLAADRPLAAQENAASGAIGRMVGQLAFQQLFDEVKREAPRHGITTQTLDRALAGLTPDRDVLRRLQNQPELNTPVWDYIDARLSRQRIAAGQALRKRHRRMLAAITARYGVDETILLAIWGLETNYGRNKGDKPVIRSLATLAITETRADFGKKQLFAALKILQDGDVSLRDFNGSWAGAMGHTQFIPTTYAAYAVDWTGDGQRDIWRAVSDALASTANYLRHSGWRPGLAWGWEVRAPKGYRPEPAERSEGRMIGEWAKRGFRTATGGGFRKTSKKRAWLLQPAGADGPWFLVTGNFKAILAYNRSTSYALSVGLLARAISGRKPLVTPWPKGLRPLSRQERLELQQLLAERGYYAGKMDGRFGPRTIAAIERFQADAGQTVDGHADEALLRRIRERK